MKWPYVDCQGLAGAWTLGTIQTGGFELVHRASLGAFGDKVIDSNRHLVGLDWTQDDGNGFTEWEPVHGVAYLNGTPPCSGFSLLNVTAAAARKHGKDAPATGRGIDSSINSCMRELIQYAGRCTGTDGKKGPEVIAFESVQGAGKEGRPLMQDLRITLENLTGNFYALSHVFMSGSTVGSAQMRHRYYPVFHRIPFGVDKPEPRRVATYRDAIGDLINLELSWDPQAVFFDKRQTWWLREFDILGEVHPPYVDTNYLGESSYYVVDAMAAVDDAAPSRHMYLHDLMPFWELNEGHQHALRRYKEEHGDVPEAARKGWDYENDKTRGFSGPRRITPDRPGYVLTGGCAGDFVHWEHPRFLTVRECARLMGYPDDWTWSTASGVNQASALIGKCCPVQSGRWISNWVLRALNGLPGSALEKVGGNEFSCNFTLDYKRWDREVSQLDGSVK